MAYLWTTYNVHSPQETADFYGKLLGMKIIRSQTAHGAEILFIGFGTEGETLVELMPAAPEAVDCSPNLSIGFSVPDLDAVLENAKNMGATILSDIISPVPGVRFFFVSDPNGMRVQLFEQR